MKDSTMGNSRFVFRGTDSNGTRMTLEEYAANVGAARYRLENQGYENLELVSDDLKFRVDQAIGNEEVWNGMTVAERQRFEEEVASAAKKSSLEWSRGYA